MPQASEAIVRKRAVRVGLGLFGLFVIAFVVSSTWQLMRAAYNGRPSELTSATAQCAASVQWARTGVHRAFLEGMTSRKPAAEILATFTKEGDAVVARVRTDCKSSRGAADIVKMVDDWQQAKRDVLAHHTERVLPLEHDLVGVAGNLPSTQ